VCELYNYYVVAHYSVLINRKVLTAVNIDVMVCCDVTSCELVERQCVIPRDGHSASIFDKKNKTEVFYCTGIGHCSLRAVVIKVDVFVL
jgi:hypothetical protein